MKEARATLIKAMLHHLARRDSCEMFIMVNSRLSSVSADNRTIHELQFDERSVASTLLQLCIKEEEEVAGPQHPQLRRANAQDLYRWADALIVVIVQIVVS